MNIQIKLIFIQVTVSVLSPSRHCQTINPQSKNNVKLKGMSGPRVHSSLPLRGRLLWTMPHKIRYVDTCLPREKECKIQCILQTMFTYHLLSNIHLIGNSFRESLQGTCKNNHSLPQVSWFGIRPHSCMGLKNKGCLFYCLKNLHREK